MKNTALINLKGKNIKRFLLRLIHNQINLSNIYYISRDEANVIIDLDDLDKVIKLKSIYEVNIKEQYGKNKLQKNLKNNIFFIISMIVGIGILFTLSSLVFDIKIIHTDKEIREFMTNELKKYGIVKYSFQKNFTQIQKIKNQILENYKDKIEWLEIEKNGVSYIVRLEERKQNNINDSNEIKNIVAKKDAIIKKISAAKGTIVKNVNDYVKKGDILISSEIKLNDEIKNNVPTEGTIYGEVWYNITVEQPYYYYEELKTNKSKKIYTFNFLNKSLELFNFKPYKNKKNTKNIVFKNRFIPFSLTKDLQEEVIVKESIYTPEESINKAKEVGIQKLNDKLKEDEHVIDAKVIDYIPYDDKLVLNLFVTVYESIGEYVKVE